MATRNAIFLSSVAFVIGFTLVFSIVGIILQTLLSGVSVMAVGILRTIGGIIITIFGLLMIASVRYSVPIFSREHKIKARRFSSSYLSPFIFGIAFAIGWTPCVGAILGSIYTLAAVSPGIGFVLLLAYSLGIGIPFLIAGLFTDRIQGALERSQKLLKYFNIIGGAILIVLGLLVIFNYTGIIAVFFVGSGGAVSLAGQINFFIAFLAGVVTFFSPCILPLLPAFFSYMAGTAANESRVSQRAS